METNSKKHIAQKTVEVIKKTVEETADSITFHLTVKLQKLKSAKV